MTNEARPGQERAPWRDPYGWHAQREALMYADPNDGHTNFKRSSITVPGDLGFPDLTYSLTTIRMQGASGSGTFTLFLEWIDEMGRPNRVRIPGEVFKRAQSAADTLTRENRSRRAAEAAAQRRAANLDA